MPDSHNLPINCTQQGPVLLVEMRRPESGNALSRELQQALVAAWDELESEDGLLVGVLHGAGGDILRGPRCRGTAVRRGQTRPGGRACSPTP